MNENSWNRHETSRITCYIHTDMRFAIAEHLAALGVDEVFVESGKNVRQLSRNSFPGLPGKKIRLHNSPIDIYRFSVERENSGAILEKIIGSGEIALSKQGAILSQEAMEYRDSAFAEEKTGMILKEDAKSERGGKEKQLLPDLSLVTCILPSGERMEQIVRIALDLGTCVPFVTLGRGTGMRDNLGLLRVTIPPEKEIVHLMVPKYDVKSVIGFIVEEGNLHLPGSGFLYTTPVSSALPDRRLRIGRQTQAASTEQIIAAIDELKGGTHWRNRFTTLEDIPNHMSYPLRESYREIVFVCKEGWCDKLMHLAIKAGAGGGTATLVRRLQLQISDKDTAAYERGIICAPTGKTEQILEALFNAKESDNAAMDLLQVISAPVVYSH